MRNQRISAKTLKEWGAFLLLGCFAWGTSFLWIKIAVGDIGPMALVTFRLFFGAAAIWLFLWLKRFVIPRDLKAIGIMAFVGLINTAIPFTLISWGEVHIDSGLAGILNGTVPLFTIIIAHLALHDDRISLPKITGLLTGFAGVILLLSKDLSMTGLSSDILGQLAVVVAAVLYGTSSVVIRKFLKGYPPMLIGAVSMTSALIFMSLTAPWIDPNFRLPTQPITWLAVAWLGLIGSALAYLMYFFLIQAWGPTRSTLVTYVMPVMAVMLGTIFLGEQLTWQLVVGGLLIIGGIAVVNIKPRRAETPVVVKN
jgi:drug/metabolite transporter (DMT)-like permease